MQALQGCTVGQGSPAATRTTTYTVDQDNEVVSLNGTAGIISHVVVIGADQGPIGGLKRKGQQSLECFISFGGGRVSARPRPSPDVA